MRAGWTKRLRDLMWAADNVVEEILDVVIVERDSLKELQSDWQVADSTVGFDPQLDGGLQLAAANDLVLSYAPTPDADVTDLDRTSPITTLFIEWAGADTDFEIKNIVLKVDPDVSDAGRTVEEWKCRVFRVKSFGPEDGQVVLDPRGEMSVAETGNAEHDLTFNFVVNGKGVRVGEPPEELTFPSNGAPVSTLTRPITAVMLFAIKGAGEAATNASWRAKETGSAGAVTGGDTPAWSIVRWALDSIDSAIGEQSNMGGGGAYRRDVLQTKAPLIQINRRTFAAATIQFTGSNRLDLGSAPAGSHDVEFTVEGEEPFDSTIIVQVRNPSGPGAWFTVADGDLAATDNRYVDADGITRGNDLTGLPKLQAYDLKVTLTPSTSLLSSPILRRVGILELEVQDFAGAAVINKVFWGIEPRTLKAEITEASATILKTGERDYRDYFTELFSKTHIGQILFRLWLGHSDPAICPRSDWLLVDAFEPDDYTPGDAGGEVLLVSVLDRMRTTIPPFVDLGGGAGARTAVQYAGVTLKAALEDVIDSLIALPARFRGPLLPSTATDIVSKTIKEADGKDEADRLAYLAGYALISSQGRVRAVQIMEDQGGERPSIATFSKEECAPIDLSPGLRQRIDEFFVKYGWTDERQEWAGEMRRSQSLAIAKLRSPGVDSHEDEDEEVCKWIDGQALADKVAKRKVESFWFGTNLWHVKSTYGHPYLEIGDVVTVETDQFVGRSPIDDREIKGLVSARATIVQQYDARGHEWVAWVKSLDDVRTAGSTGTRIGYWVPEILQADVYFGNDGALYARGQIRNGASVRGVHNNLAYQGTSTVDAQAVHTVDADGFFNFQLAAAGTYAIGQTAYVTLHAYEKADGSGKRSSPLWKVPPALRTEDDEIDSAPTIDEDNGAFFLYPNRAAFAQAVYYTVTTNDTDPADPKGSSEGGGPVGTLSTLGEIALGLGTLIDGQVVRAKVKAVANADGSGAVGPIRILRETYHVAATRPTVSWMRYQSTDLTKEAVRFTARAAGSQVNFGYAVLDDTAAEPTWPGGFTTPGLVSDPKVQAVEVTKPVPAAANKRIWYQAVDANGSFAYVKPQFVTIDSNEIPTGWFTTVERLSDGLVSVLPNTDDSDTGSWRFRVFKTTTDDATFNLPAFDDGAADEFKGNTFGTPVDLTGYKLGYGERLNIAGYFFRTTSTTAATQAASMRSVASKAFERQGLETENSIKIVAHKWIPTVDGAGRSCWNLQLQLAVGAQCQSGLIRVRYTRNPSGGGHIVSDLRYNFNLSPSGQTIAHTVRVGTAPAYPTDPATIQNFFYDDTETYTGILIDVDPYNAINGIAGTGTLGVGTTGYAPTHLDVTPDVGIRAQQDGASGEPLFGDHLVIEQGLQIETDANGRPKLKMRATISTSAPSGTPVDGELWLRY